MEPVISILVGTKLPTFTLRDAVASPTVAVTRAVPSFNAVILPDLSTETTPLASVVQVTRALGIILSV